MYHTKKSSKNSSLLWRTLSLTQLGRPFSSYEIEHVVRSMKKEKAPGPDGIEAEVLQELVKFACADLCDMINAFRAAGALPKTLNTGLIKLIPKGGDRLETRNYRPLTMLNSVYKVMAKALANRIKDVVGQVVHPKQFGFVQGRSIHEAIMKGNHLYRMGSRASRGICDDQHGSGEGI